THRVCKKVFMLRVFRFFSFFQKRKTNFSTQHMKTSIILGCTLVVLVLIELCAAGPAGPGGPGGFNPRRYRKCHLLNEPHNSREPGELVNCEFEADYIV